MGYKKQRFAYLQTNASPSPPTLHQNHHHHSQPTNVWKQIIYCPGHCDFTICTKKWERERQSIFCKAKFIQFKWLFFILRLYSSYFKCTKVSLLLYNDAMADGDMGFSVFFFSNVLGWQVKKLETLLNTPIKMYICFVLFSLFPGA